MYARPTDRVESPTLALEILEAASFVHLVSMGSDGFVVTSLPMMVDRDTGLLKGHLARANPHWKTLDNTSVVVIAVASQNYVSPGWYPSKQTSEGRVVPTWNYESVHVHGVARLHHDADWLATMVNQLTDLHESKRTDGSERWAVSDAPTDFIEQQLNAIVGVSVSIDRIEAKQKLSANRPQSDRSGVIKGLSQTLPTPTRMVEMMFRSLETQVEP